MLYYSDVQKNYMTALQQKNEEAFYHGCPGAVGPCGSCGPIFMSQPPQNKRSVDLTWRSELNGGKICRKPWF